MVQVVSLVPSNLSSYSSGSYHVQSLLLSIRGGAQKSSLVETAESIYISSAVGFFNNLRVPAAVLISIVMKEMFALQSTPPSAMRAWDAENGIDKSTRWRTLRYTYLLLMVLAFSLETNTIFIATQVLTQLATAQMVDFQNKDDTNTSMNILFGMVGGRKDTATSMVDFLLKNFEFEYATVRLHFFTGLLSFTVAQALRVRYALRKYSALSMSGMCLLLTVATGMLTYTNANTITYGGYFNLLKRQLQLSFNFLRNRAGSGPMSTITATLFFLTIAFAIVGSFSPEFAYFEDEEEEGSKSWFG